MTTEAYFGANEIGILLFGYIQDDINVNAVEPNLMTATASKPLLSNSRYQNKPNNVSSTDQNKPNLEAIRNY